MRHNLWRYASWSLFLILCAIVTYGLLTSGIFTQQIWTPEGSKRFLLFVAICLAVATLVVLTRPVLLVVVTSAAAVSLAISAGGWLPIAAVLFCALSAVVLGAALLQASDGWFGTEEEIPLACMIGLSVYVFFVGVAVPWPINFPVVWFIVLVIPLLARARLALECLQIIRLGIVRQRSTRVTFLLAANLCLALMHWIVTLTPEVSADGLAMHLVIPTTVATTHQWHFNVERFSWAVMPMAGDWCFTIAYLLGGEQAARLMNALLLFAVTALIGYIARRSVSAVATLVITGAFLATPIVQLVTGSLFIENFLAAALIGAVAAGTRGHGWIAAGLCGTAVATKVGAFGAAVPIVLAIVLRLKSGTSRAVCLAVFLLAGCSPYLRAWLRTGNPLFPFLNDIFRSPFFETAALTDDRFTSPVRWTTLYDLVFKTSHFLEGQDGAFGFHYLLLLPLAVFFFRWRDWPWHSKVALLAFAVAVPIIFSAQANARYIYPVLPLLLVAVGAAWHTVRDLSLSLYRAFVIVTAVLACLSVAFLPASGWYHKQFLVPPFDAAKLQDYVDENAPGRSLVSYFNTRYPSEPVLFLVNGQSAGLRGRVYLNSWHNYSFQRLFMEARNVADVGRVLNGARIRSVVAPSQQRAGELKLPILRDFLQACGIPEYEVNGYIAARISTRCAAPLTIR